MSEQPFRIWAFVAAAGRGERLGADRPKQYLEVGGETLISRSIRAVGAHPAVAGIVVGIASDDVTFASLDIRHPLLLGTVAGGSTRAVTVLNGVRELQRRGSDSDWILVHDAARPFLTPADLAALIKTIDSGSDGAVLGWPVRDSVANADPEGRVQGSVDRTGLWRTATPQLFQIGALERALESAAADGIAVTDELAAMHRAGYSPTMIETDRNNFKVTTMDDLHAAQRIVAGENSIRVGNGFDVHRLETGRPLILGGVEIEHTHGLAGHSDADVLIHAIIDALLGGAGLGDIGQHFPDTDVKWKGADSRQLLRAVAELVAKAGYGTGNIDATIIAEAPRMAPHIARMRQNIAEDLGVVESCINVKATTTEGLGYAGRREGIAAQASAVLVAGSNTMA